MARSHAVNAVELALSEETSGVSTTFTLASTSAAPAVPCYAVVDLGDDTKREYVLFTVKTGTTLQTADLDGRYLDGSAAGSDLTHGVGAKVLFVPVAQNLSDLWDAVEGRVETAGDTMTGELAVPSLSVSGLTGAVEASRYVGATTSGAPATGTFAVGDYVIARDGKVWICTVAGTPGTWVEAGSSGASGLIVLGSAQVDTAQLGIGGTFTDLTGSDVSVTIGTKPVIVRAWWHVEKKSSTGNVAFHIFDVTAGAIVNQSRAATTLVIDEFDTIGEVSARLTPAAGARTYRCRLFSSAGTVDAQRGRIEILEESA